MDMYSNPGDLPARRGGAARGEVLLGLLAKAEDFSGEAGEKGGYKSCDTYPSTSSYTGQEEHTGGQTSQCKVNFQHIYHP